MDSNSNVPEETPNALETESIEAGAETGLTESLDTAPDTEGAADEGTGEGRVRDPATGRFVPKAKAEEGQTTVPPEGEAEAPLPETPDAKPADAAAPPVSSTSRPFAVKALGQFHELEGATLNADGTLNASPQAVEMIHTYMGRGVKYEVEVPRLKARIQELERTKSEEAEWVRAVGEEYAALAQLPDEHLIEAIQEFRMRYPTLREKVRADQLEKQLQQIQRASQPDPQQFRQQQEAQFETTFASVFDEMVQSARGVLGPDELKELKDELYEIRDSFLIVADRDIEAEDEENSVRKGEWLINDQRMDFLVNRRIEQVRKYKAAQAKDQAARAANAAVLAPTKAKAPPLAGNSSGSPSESNGQPIKSREEWQRAMFGSAR